MGERICDVENCWEITPTQLNSGFVNITKITKNDQAISILTNNQVLASITCKYIAGHQNLHGNP